MTPDQRRTTAARIVMGIVTERGPGPDGRGYISTAPMPPTRELLVMQARYRHLVPHGVQAADLPRIIAVIEQHLAADVVPTISNPPPQQRPA